MELGMLQIQHASLFSTYKLYVLNTILIHAGSECLLGILYPLEIGYGTGIAGSSSRRHEQSRRRARS